MRYLLDTNVWSEMARPEPMASVRRAFQRYDPQFAMAAPVADELTFGVARLPNSKRKVLLAEWLEETLDAYPILPSIFRLHDGMARSGHAEWRSENRRPWSMARLPPSPSSIV